MMSVLILSKVKTIKTYHLCCLSNGDLFLLSKSLSLTGKDDTAMTMRSG